MRPIVLVGIAVVASCRPSRDSAPPPADTAVVAAPAPSRADSMPTSNPTASSAPQDSVAPLLEAGCSGGITGGGSGTFLTADGGFYRYQRNGPAPRAKREDTFVRRDSAAARELVESAEREEIARVKYLEVGNMTCHLTLTRGSTSSEISWPINTAPAAISKLVAVAKALEAAAGGR